MGCVFLEVGRVMIAYVWVGDSSLEGVFLEKVSFWGESPVVSLEERMTLSTFFFVVAPVADVSLVENDDQLFLD